MLVAARFILGQNQIEVANDSGMSSRTLYKVENGTAGIVPVEKLMRYYASKGVTFVHPEGNSGWGIKVGFLTHSYDDELPTEGR
ncbi:hypothetical protein EV131_10216 [Rhizobium laguerreae]|uniref:Helix-turn-helix domain-containing protein n=1 Tax=Rhizobium laguerreae TaxID=1076926 RepID=A0AAX2QRH8_9HYPH|nr:hypothetical protein EV131_10216 [Rhizobium laguerreae]